MTDRIPPNSPQGTDAARSYWTTLLRNPHYDFTQAERDKLAAEIERLREAVGDVLDYESRPTRAALSKLREVFGG